MIWDAFFLSLRVTAVATVIILVLGLALGWLFARARFRGKLLLELLVALPLVLPPSVVGYYLLRALGSGSPVVEWLHIELLFTWQAAAVASAVVGLPLMVQSARAAIANVDPALENAARTLGSTEVGLFWRVTLPLARRGILAGLILGAARALGEFGATLMVAGSIPGKTQTMPLAIYDAVQSGQRDAANQMVLLMTALAFLGLWFVRGIESPRKRKAPKERAA
ncbi:MAG: molybdate ABC transporter permease subunit [Chloroflexi bacterium]|nr:molybdate ABC transporter permease subunit [Chloroflexota bacterium]